MWERPTRDQVAKRGVTSMLYEHDVCVLARLFSMLRFESVIHESDPYFNYRATMMLVNKVSASRSVTKSV
jgi:dolichyl-diphosphooligosaccharide--protein glycosyltransferase